MHAILNLVSLFRSHFMIARYNVLKTLSFYPCNMDHVIVWYPEHRFYEIEVDLFRKESRMQYEHDELP